jgi:hypothetical protein
MMKKEEFNEFKLKVSAHMAELHHARQGVDGPSEAQLLEATMVGLALNTLAAFMFDLPEVKEMQDKLNTLRHEEADAEEFGA